MFDRIDMLRMAGAMTDHAARRQKIVARNIANADTPGFKARDLPDFADGVRAGTGPVPMRATRGGHVTEAAFSPAALREAVLTDVAPSPNGNTVTLEDEMFRMAMVSRQQNLSIAIYKAGLDLMRSSLGRR